MATIVPHVRPGDLITANQWNAVIDWLTALQATVDGLGVGTSTSGPPVIVGLQPTDPPIGSELLVLGSGFGLAAENTVTIANLTAVVLAGGGNQLRVRVPVVPGIPPAGVQTQITVSNPRGFASAQILVLPPVLSVPEGQLFANMTTSPPGTINANSTADFIFTVRAVVNIAETYTLSPLLTPQTNAAAWQAQVLDASSNPISTITIPAGAPPTGEARTVRVRVTVPAGTNGTTCGLALTMTSQRNPSLVTSSPTFTLTVGAAAPPPEQLTVTRSGVQNGGLDPDGTVVVRPSTTRVTFSVAGTQAGVNYTVSTGTAPAGWAASVVGGATQGAQGTQLTVRIDFTPGAAAGTFSLRVSRSDDNTVFGTLALAVRPQ
jgi:hypothetical protein